LCFLILEESIYCRTQNSDVGAQDCNPSVMALSGKCVPFRLASKWACNVDPNAPLPFYPRPQMTRGNNDTWVSLNGIWEWEPSV
jgi:hypothetical protein